MSEITEPYICQRCRCVPCECVKSGHPDYFCQWCYDQGLRYPDDGKPWRHGVNCPNHKGVDNTPHPSSCACAECRIARLRAELDNANSRVSSEIDRGEQWCRDFIALKKALRQAGDCFTRIEDTRFGYDGDCGVVGIANEGNEIINKALNP